jgi:hypothetical protein
MGDSVMNDIYSSGATDMPNMSMTEDAIQRRMAKYGFSREAAIANIEEQMRMMSGNLSYDSTSDVSDPESNVQKVTSITESADGSKKTVIEENKTNTPIHRGEQEKTGESKPMQLAPSETFDVEDPYVNDVDPSGVPMGLAQAAEESMFDGSGGIGDIEDGTPMQFAPQVSEMDEPSEGGMMEVLVDEAPEVVPWVDEFIGYIEGVNEKEAMIAADHIMNKASETGLDKVKPRAYKALGLALASMMFGADAQDAFSQGLEVVGKDYAAEAAASAMQAQTIADQQKFMFEESFKTDEAIRKETGKSKREMANTNYTVMKDMASHIQGMDPELKDALGLKSAMGEIQKAADSIQKSYGPMNLKDPEIGGNFYDGIENWLLARAAGNTVEPLDSFIKDQIARAELTKYEGTLNNAHIVPEGSTNSKQQREDIAALFDTVMSVAGLQGSKGDRLGEAAAIKLMMQDFIDYQDVKSAQAGPDAKEAREKGMTPFVYFASTYVVDGKIGRKYKQRTDEELAGILGR